MNRRIGFVALLVLAVLATAYLTAVRRTAGPPLDPASTAPDGARAVVELVDSLATMTVRDDVPDGSVDTALLLADHFDRDQAAAVEAWVRAGGTLVVADPSSTFTPPVAGAARDVVEVSCPQPALAAVRTLDVGDGFRYQPPPGSTGCARTGASAVVVVRSLGAGTVVSVGGPGDVHQRPARPGRQRRPGRRAARPRSDQPGRLPALDTGRRR